jgi:hypothetical protein
MTASKKKLPKSKAEAMALEAKGIEAKFYQTGIPCKRGHVGVRRTKSGSCEECTTLRAKTMTISPEQKAQQVYNQMQNQIRREDEQKRSG